ncbi:MAG: TRL-like family protein [Treponema sp.]|nr:TRL-like family protein [Treponema sp.]
MKKMTFTAGILAVMLVFGMVMLTSCASTQALTATSVTASTDTVRTGTASNFSLFGMFLWGDGGIHAAKIDGNISTVSTVDVNTFRIFGGLFQRQTTIVRGY